MRILAGNGCSGGTCPTVYEDEDGSLYVQGYDVRPETMSKVQLPHGESLVRIDRALVEAIKAS